MNSKKTFNTAGLPKLKKKTMLQQVMKPRDWASLAILIVISAFCWLWVLSAYSDPFNIDDIIRNNSVYSAIDNQSFL